MKIIYSIGKLPRSLDRGLIDSIRIGFSRNGLMFNLFWLKPNTIFPRPKGRGY